MTAAQGKREQGAVETPAVFPQELHPAGPRPQRDHLGKGLSRDYQVQAWLPLTKRRTEGRASRDFRNHPDLAYILKKRKQRQQKLANSFWF